jgi:uroporphyrinogen-III synthase
LIFLNIYTDTHPWWIVYFSPSSASFATPFLRNHFSLPVLDAAQNGRVRIAAIGPVTAAFLRDELKFHVAVTAHKPDPEILATSIAEYDRENEQTETASSHPQP